MCYAPVRKTTGLIKRAQERIAEGKLLEAGRLLSAAQGQISFNGSVSVDGVSLNQMLINAQTALEERQRTPKS